MMEFKPIEKMSELMEMFKEYNPIIHQNSDDGYDWLDENSCCIEIPNPNAGDNITIECGGAENSRLAFRITILIILRTNTDTVICVSD